MSKWISPTSTTIFLLCLLPVAQTITSTTVLQRKIQMLDCFCGQCRHGNSESNVNIRAEHQLCTPQEYCHPFPIIPQRHGIFVPGLGSAGIDSWGLVLQTDRNRYSMRYNNFTDTAEVNIDDVVYLNISHRCENRKIQLHVDSPTVQMDVHTANKYGNIEITCRLSNEKVNHFYITEKMFAVRNGTLDLQRGSFTFNYEGVLTMFDITKRRIVNYDENQKRLWNETNYGSVTQWSTTINGDHFVIKIDDRSVLRQIVNGVINLSVWLSDGWTSLNYIESSNVQFQADWHAERQEAIVTCGGVTTSAKATDRSATAVYDPNPSSHFAYWPFANAGDGKRQLAFQLGPFDAMIDTNFDL